MIHRLLAGLALCACPAIFFSGCIEADISNELREDGSGQFGMSMAFTPKMVEIMHKLQELGDEQDMKEQMEEALLEEPDEATKEELGELGLRIEEFENVASDTELKSSAVISYDRLSALQHMRELSTEGPGGSASGFRLTRDEKGIYTLFTTEVENEEEAVIEEDEPEELEEPEMPGEGDEDDPQKMAQMFALMGEMMGEMQKLKMTMKLTVPGEIVGFAPETGAVQDGNAVTWTLGMEQLMSMGMAGMGGAAEGSDSPQFEVRFQMPEGKEIPEEALWAGPPEQDPREEPGSDADSNSNEEK